MHYCIVTTGLLSNLAKSYTSLSCYCTCRRLLQAVKNAIVVFWNIFFEKLFFKFFYVCLTLEKLINEKHFPVKEKFGLVSRKVFF
jgi:hypothetical protein